MMPADIEGAFREHLRRADMPTSDLIIADGKIRRFRIEGDKPGRRNGSYALFCDARPAGWARNWRAGNFTTWKAGDAPVTPKEREHIERQVKRRAEKDARLAATAAKRAQGIWERAAAHKAVHLYFERRKLQTKAPICQTDLRIGGVQMRGAALVPMRDADGNLRSVQFITCDGKYYLPGAPTAGLRFMFGKVAEDAPLILCEGAATGLSLHLATGYAVCVAFDAGNLLRVARSLRDKYPALEIIIAADNDQWTEGNPGERAARAAEQAVGAVVAMPEFRNSEAKPTDFDDLRQLEGNEAVVRFIENARASRRSEPGAQSISADAAPPPALEASAQQQGGDQDRPRAPDSQPLWPPPKPIVAELKPVPAFDAQTLLPEALRAWVMDEAERMPCPPEFIAAAALVALGSLIGARCAIKPKARDSWLIVPNVWGGIVGDPSAKKSPAWAAALKPLDRLIATARERHQAESEQYATAKVVFDAQKDAIVARIKGASRAKKSGKGEPAQIARELRTHNDQAPAQPTLRRYKTNDSTVEKLGELLRENPAGLLVLRDELVGLIATWEREGREGERAFFLEAWNGTQGFDTDRIGRGHISIENLCVSLFGGIQPDKLLVYLEQAAHALGNDGMLQRFQLLVYPDARPWEWRDRAPNKAARDTVVAVFETLADFRPEAWGAAPAADFAKFPWFCFDAAAQAVFIEWSEDLHCNRMPSEDEPIIRQHLAKFDKLFPALALIFHLVDGAAEGVRGPVDRDAALRAAAWCEFLEAHARRCYGLLKDDGLRAAQALAAKLERQALEDGFTLRDVRRNQWRNLTADAAIEAALDWLEDEGWLRSETSGGTGPGSGRRTVRYRINPALRVRGSAA
jgi:phage/plasmid primase-like uncharacterized protein